MTHIWKHLGSDGKWLGVSDLSRARVVVVGDVMTDRWVYGLAMRLSPEAPVPVFIPKRTVETPGGAANVAANVQAMGATATLLTAGVQPLKTRYVDRQTLLRVDEENPQPISEAHQAAILEALAPIECDVLVISDYAKGVCTPPLCQKLIHWAKDRGVKVVVDPKGMDWSKYDDCNVITPNRAEWEALGVVTPRGPCDIIVTAGENGARIFSFDGKTIEIPGRPVPVKDVAGCGDTFVATLSCALAVGMDLVTAARLANAAASVVVGKAGTAVCTPEELEAAMEDTHANI